MTHTITNISNSLGLCARSDSFIRIGMVDSVVDITNADIPCLDVNNAARTNCIGDNFVVNGEPWYVPQIKLGIFALS
jgi:hypothetical protein